MKITVTHDYYVKHRDERPIWLIYRDKGSSRYLSEIWALYESRWIDNALLDSKTGEEFGRIQMDRRKANRWARGLKRGKRWF